MLSTLWKRVRPWLPWALVLLLLWLLVQAVHPAALWVALQHARLWLLLPVLGCAALGLLLRGIRWHLLLDAIDVPNTMEDSIILFTAAQAAVLLPGGQFLLPVLQRSQHGTLIRHCVPTILVQELIFGLLMLPAALPGVPPYHPAGWLLLIALVFNAGTAIFLLQSRLLGWGLRLTNRLPFIRDHVHNLAELQRLFVVVARSPATAWGTIFDMATIALSGVGFWLSLLAVHATDVGWVDGIAVYALGSSVGTISMLPGGLGANEGVSTLLLSRLGVAVGLAAAGTLLFRVTNLLVNVLVGWAVLVLARRRLKVHPTPHGIARAVRGAERKTAAGAATSEEPVRYIR
jgi:uncharacterized membrane protein YbhN (UPF0104 family)